jgi:hypothetical protein
MDGDILGCQKMEKVGSRVFLHIDSYDLHDNRFCVEKELSLCFTLDRLLFLSRVMAVFSRCQTWRGRQFEACPQFHMRLSKDVSEELGNSKIDPVPISGSLKN